MSPVRGSDLSAWCRRFPSNYCNDHAVQLPMTVVRDGDGRTHRRCDDWGNGESVVEVQSGPDQAAVEGFRYPQHQSQARYAWCLQRRSMAYPRPSAPRVSLLTPR